jgi:hypothetical protein
MKQACPTEDIYIWVLKFFKVSNVSIINLSITGYKVFFRASLDSSGLRQGSVVCCYVHGSETSRFINGRKFLDLLCNCDLLKKGLPSKELVPLNVFHNKKKEK